MRIRLLIPIFLFISVSFVFCGCRHRHYRDQDTENENSIGFRNDKDDYREERRIRRGTKVKMEAAGGVYLVPINVNGLDLKFTKVSQVKIHKRDLT